MAKPSSSKHQIDLEKAKRITHRHQQAHPGTVKAHWFSRDILDQILAQPNCSGLRVYHAINDDGTPSVAMIGTTGNETASADMAAGVIGQESKPCPPWCDPQSPLAS